MIIKEYLLLNSAWLTVLGSCTYVTFVPHSSPECVCLTFPHLFHSSSRLILFISFCLEGSTKGFTISSWGVLSSLFPPKSSSCALNLEYIQDATSIPSKVFHHVHPITEKVLYLKIQIIEGPSVIRLAPHPPLQAPKSHQGEWISYDRHSMFHRRQLLASKRLPKDWFKDIGIPLPHRIHRSDSWANRRLAALFGISSTARHQRIPVTTCRNLPKVHHPNHKPSINESAGMQSEIHSHELSSSQDCNLCFALTSTLFHPLLEGLVRVTVCSHLPGKVPVYACYPVIIITSTFLTLKWGQLGW